MKMAKGWVSVLFFVAFIHVSTQMSTPNSTSYMAAVVEFAPVHKINDTEATLQANVDKYITFIQRARTDNVDIIVFPEDGLTTISLPSREKMEPMTTLIPPASANYTPCTQGNIGVSETMKKISCAARHNNVYVVINIAEKEVCSGDTCPTDGVYYYNTNVAFDRTGKIIARYRKTHLFGERQLNVTAEPEVVTFDTDFGVRFGMIICFDIMFAVPSLELTRKHHVTDIVFPTAWFSETPFLTAGQTQFGWAYAEDVNLLAAGYNRPSTGSMGSGIYAGRKGIKKITVPIREQTTVLISEVPKIVRNASMNSKYTSHVHEHERPTQTKLHVHDELRRKRQTNTASPRLLRDKVETFETVPFTKNITQTVCQNDFCCDFKVETSAMDPLTKYRLAVFSGKRLYGKMDIGGVFACGVIQCSNDTIESCGSVHDSETNFTTIEISGKFQNYDNLLIMPSTLLSNLLPLQTFGYHEHTHDDHVHLRMTLSESTRNLASFGIYSRDFSRDGTVNAGWTNVMHVSLLLSSLLLMVSL